MILYSNSSQPLSKLQVLHALKHDVSSEPHICAEMHPLNIRSMLLIGSHRLVCLHLSNLVCWMDYLS